jgi:hypothetical protein
MLRRRAVFDEGSAEATASLREQDDEFCKMLRAAIEGGRESCPVGVSTRPGTKKPVWLPRPE